MRVLEGETGRRSTHQRLEELLLFVTRHLENEALSTNHPTFLARHPSLSRGRRHHELRLPALQAREVNVLERPPARAGLHQRALDVVFIRPFEAKAACGLGRGVGGSERLRSSSRGHLVSESSGWGDEEERGADEEEEARM